MIQVCGSRNAAADAAKSAFAFEMLFMNLYAPNIAIRMNGIQNHPAERDVLGRSNGADR